MEPGAKFDLEKVKRIMRPKIEKGLEFVGMWLQGYIVKSFPATSGRGADHIPSPPGQPPSVDLGGLKTSIAWALDKEGENPAVKVGTNIEYGPRQEFGFVGTDSLGRVYNQPARPYLRPAAAKTKEIQQAFAQGAKKA